MADEPIVLEIEGLKELSKALAKFRGQSDQMLKEALVPGMSLIASDAKKKAPVDTGRLMSSIGADAGHTFGGKPAPGILEVKKVGSEIIGRVGSAVVYARIQEFGGTIHAKTGPYLTFRTRDGKWHKVPSVTIPPHPYLRPALEATRDRVVKLFETSIAGVLRKLGL